MIVIGRGGAEGGLKSSRTKGAMEPFQFHVGESVELCIKMPLFRLGRQRIRWDEDTMDGPETLMAPNGTPAFPCNFIICGS